MNKSSPPITQNPLIYYSQLKSVNGVKFTPREIDVIACLLSGKGSKTIAHFLSIEEKTVETHKYNIMRKLECNSKEGIIEFIEKSDKFSVLKQHYLTLLSEAIFEKHLSKILSFNRNIRHSSLLFYEKNSHFINQLENHLKRAGINIFGESLDKHKSLPQLIHHITAQEVESIIYIISRPLLEKMKEPDNQSKLEMAELTQKLAQNNTRVIFVLERDDISLEIPQEIRDAGYVDFGTEDSYYFTVLKVLQTLLPKVDLDKFTSDFKHQYQTIYESSAKTSSQTWSPIDDLPQAENSGSSISSVFSKQKRKIVVFGSTLVLSSTCLLFLTLNNNSYYPKGPSEKIHNLQSIRSDLPIPADKTLLNRPELLKQIDEALKGNEGIQTVALVGIGGAGKTTLARQYAQKQKAPIIWEINAETKGSFIGSFENLAYSLCRRDEERKTLRELQDIKNSLDRQERIILFVKERLKLYPNWVLIFDNIEKFDSLQTYFPSDSATWGSGKIIVTTRDANIQNNNHINQTIHIGELKRQEKYLLFSNIMHQGNIHNISTPHQEQTHKFLNHLPPFPLDISIAAYYLKTTNVTYEKYLEYLKEYNQSFESIQENILKETNEYTKTRYGIVTLSLKNLIEINEIFPSLLLFVSLLDSQNIPKDLLSTLKSDVVVDNFIYHLKQYSLITNESKVYDIPSISVHRSTQAISLKYLIKTMNIKREDEILGKIGIALENYLAKAIDEDELLKMKSHCEVFLTHSELLPISSQAAARCALGALYFYLGNYAKAKTFLEQNLAILNKSAVENFSVIARTLGYLGTTYRILGNYEKARLSLEESLSIYQEHLSENHIKVAWILAQIGIVYRDLGNYGKAKDLIEQSLELYKQHLPAEHTKISWALATLATVHIELGDYLKAKDMLEKSLTSYRNYCSDNHIRIAWVSAHLGIIYHELGDQIKAKDLLEKSLTVYKEYFFDKHIELARALRHLGGVYKALKEYEKAKSVIERSIEICKKNYGSEHFDIAWGLTNLAEVNLLEGDVVLAEEHLKNASLILQSKSHPEYYTTLERLSDLHVKKAQNDKTEGKNQNSQNNIKEAINFLRQSLQILKTHYSKESRHLVRFQSKLEKLEHEIQR